MRITKKFLRDCGFKYDDDHFDPYWFFKNDNVLINYRQTTKSLVWFKYKTGETFFYESKTRETLLKILTLYGAIDGRPKDT